jgi:hypothetical protein
MTDAKLPEKFHRKLTDRAYDTVVGCGRDGCTDPDCEVKVQRDTLRAALGTVVEAMQCVAFSQTNAFVLWGQCTDRGCTFEAELQEHFVQAGRDLGAAFANLMMVVQMWKALPQEWPFPELDGADEALMALENLGLKAIDQALARKRGELEPGGRPN